MVTSSAVAPSAAPFSPHHPLPVLPPVLHRGVHSLSTVPAFPLGGNVVAGDEVLMAELYLAALCLSLKSPHRILPTESLPS